MAKIIKTFIEEAVLGVISALFSGSINAFKNLVDMSDEGANTLVTFQKVFFGDNFNTVWQIFMALGIFTLFAILIFQVFKGLFGPLVSAENPLKLCGKFLIFAILVGCSKNICMFFFQIASIPYNAFNNMPPSFDYAGAISLVGEGFTDLITENAAGGPAMAAGMELGKLVLEILSTIVDIFMMFMILVSFVRFLIEIVERYVITGVCCLFSPICIATGVSDGTNKIFKSWIQVMISQCILMCLSIFFLTGTLSAMQNLASSPNTFVGLMMILAWLRVGVEIDKHISKLGLTTLQAGDGLYKDMIAGKAAQMAALQKAQRVATIATGVNAVSANGGALGGIGIKSLGNSIAQNGIGGTLKGLGQDFGAYVASQEGAQMYGQGASRLARHFNGGEANLAAARFDAARYAGASVSIMQDLQEDYGNVQSSDDGESLNDKLAKGDMMNGVTKDDNGNYLLSMTDYSSEQNYTMTFSQDDNGNKMVHTFS